MHTPYPMNVHVHFKLSKNTIFQYVKLFSLGQHKSAPNKVSSKVAPFYNEIIFKIFLVTV